jgi:hypothetical protein
MRVWSFLVIPITATLVIAACGGGDNSTFNPGGNLDGGNAGDMTVEPPPTLGEAGTDGNGGGHCTPRTCATLGYNCGPNSDGCGGLLQCGNCMSPEFCGGGGYSKCGGNLAAQDSGGNICMPKSCAAQGYTCGPNSDGCGSMLDCGTCTAPQYCGGAGYSKCGGNSVAADSGGNVCVPTTCAALGYNCGAAADGCGHALNCGNCSAPQFCGGAGFDKCGGNSQAMDSGGNLCVPTTCAALGYNCGPADDGCGHQLSCGTCTAPQFCGGGGFSVCGGNSNAQDGGSICVPTTCALLGYNCGPAGNGCGGTLNCGSCASPQYCGGGGFNQCGGNMNALDGGSVCVPRTCAQLGYNCGPAGDGCGNLLQCGNCVSPNVCGGGGVPGVCGNSVPCTGLCQQQVTCDAGATTSISGRVIAGTLAQYGTPDPVPNVLVYVPNAPVLPFTPGVQCSQCGADVSGSPLVETTTAVDGTFTLNNMPVGASIPLVIQLGRWRRQITVGPIAACTNLAVGSIHMPRSQAEGDIPLTAIATGNVDSLECVLLKMGVAQSEFRDPGQGGRIEVYVADQVGGPGAQIDGATPSETGLYTTQAELSRYDQVLFPCEGIDGPVNNSEAAADQGRVINYTNSGGRVFATHYSYVWLYNDNPFSTTAAWNINAGAYNSVTGVIDTAASPRVATFGQWMVLIGAAAGSPPTFTVLNPRHDFDNPVVSPSLRWIYTNQAGGANAHPAFPLHYTFNTPVGGASQCGRVIYSDFHVTNSASAGVTFPNECPAGVMTAQEKALEYMIWDLASCVPGPPPPQCTPLTCAQQNINCGPAGDGCGNQIACGNCPAGQTCGGGGVYGQCGSVDGGNCTPQTCAQQGIQCGPAGDGCGNQLACGPCTPPATCGGGGIHGVCGYVDGGSCSPRTCGAQGIQCGPAGDGCGGLLQCGPCIPPNTCGGGGMPGVCGFVDGGNCTPENCMQQGFNCGPAGDGCGNQINCGPCPPGQSCGGGGSPGVCGSIDGGTCVPETCQQLGFNCGPAGDGCGGLLQCGPCTPPNTCGGGGTPGVCGFVDGGSCTPKTCGQLGISCGPAGDGCGGLLNCGNCTLPQTCGGGGTPGVCGGGNH